jgi:hypothetical protein
MITTPASKKQILISSKDEPVKYNLSIGRGGVSDMWISPFTAYSSKSSKIEIGNLNKLQSQLPMTLVMQRSWRCRLRGSGMKIRLQQRHIR